mgnify:CR=1 FL=1
MKRVGTTLICVMFVLSTTAIARAEISSTPTIVITEIQTNGAGSGTTLQEFVEIANIGVSPTSVAGYKLVYTNSSAKDFDLFIFGVDSIIAAGGSRVFVPATAPTTFLESLNNKLTYIPPSSSGIAASGGKISLFDADGLLLDSLQWTNSQAAAVDDILFYGGDGKSASRKLLNVAFVYSGIAKDDFEILGTPTPLSSDPDLVTPDPLPEPETEPDPIPTPEVVDPPPDNTDPLPDTDSPETPEPDPVPPLDAPTYEQVYINELLIDPVTPHSDANDEWIELYNPSIEVVDVSSYTVFSGTNDSYKYVLPMGTSIPAGGYIVITSGDSPLSFSNGGGAAKIVAPNGTVLDSVSYAEAPSGQSWAKNSSGTWEWTTTITEASLNIITSPVPTVVKQAVASSSKAKKATSTAKVTAVKAATTKAAAKAKTTSATNFDDPAVISAPTPIPGWLLAVFIFLAVLYVAYEYRFEAANTIYRLRNYRKTGR